MLKKYTEFTYLGLTKEQKKEIGDNLKAQLKGRTPTPDIPDSHPGMNKKQREMAEIRFKAGIDEVVNKHKEDKPYNDEYIDKKLAGHDLVVCVQGQVMKKGEPVILREDSSSYGKLINLIDNADKRGKEPLYTKGETIGAISYKEAEKAFSLKKEIKVEKQKKEESKK